METEQKTNIEFSPNIAEIGIIYSRKIKISDMPQLRTSNEISELLRQVWSNKIELCEEFLILLLNCKSRVLGWCKISQGGIMGTVADSRLIFAIALKAAATGIILCHNHPSGSYEPSDADIKLTNKLVEAGKIMEIPIIDHIILTSDDYYSFADEGII